MRIVVNGEDQVVPDGLTVRGLIEHLELAEGPVAVELNHEVVPRAQHPQKRLSDGDVLEVVHFVGGG